MSNKYLICVVGPTAIGKTSLAIALAKHFGTEIISADSRQFYREMKIGTAAPTPAELTAAPHHFIRNISVEEKFTVGDFEREALLKLEELFVSHKTAILVGGSGLYVKAVTSGLDDFPEVDPSIRQELNKKYTSEGIVPLQKQLEQLDPEYYSEVDQENPHRLIRALEICLGTGKPFSSYKNQKKTQRNFHPVFIGLTADRDIIYERINFRVDEMLKNRLLEEVKNLFPKRDLNALNTVGYKELFEYFDGNLSLEEATEEIKKNSRRFAKRQLTWFKKNDQINWFDYTNSSEEIIQFIEGKIITKVSS